MSGEWPQRCALLARRGWMQRAVGNGAIEFTRVSGGERTQGVVSLYQKQAIRAEGTSRSTVRAAWPCVQPTAQNLRPFLTAPSSACHEHPSE